MQHEKGKLATLREDISVIPLQYIPGRTSFANFIIHLLSKGFPFFLISVSGVLQLLQQASSSLHTSNFDGKPAS